MRRGQYIGKRKKKIPNSNHKTSPTPRCRCQERARRATIRHQPMPTIRNISQTEPAGPRFLHREKSTHLVLWHSSSPPGLHGRQSQSYSRPQSSPSQMKTFTKEPSLAWSVGCPSWISMSAWSGISSWTPGRSSPTGKRGSIPFLHGLAALVGMFLLLPISYHPSIAITLAFSGPAVTPLLTRWWGQRVMDRSETEFETRRRGNNELAVISS